MNIKKRNDSRQPTKMYSAIDFLDEWSGAFEQLDDDDMDEVKFNYLTEKYK